MLILYGQNGFLLSNILKHNTHCIIDNAVLFFYTPIDIKEPKDEERYNQSRYNLINAITLCQKFDLRMIYASSEAVIHEKSHYSKMKLEDEILIQNNCIKYSIFRIPRVYAKDRNKGLIQDLRNNLVPYQDFTKKIEYIDIQDFLNWFYLQWNTNGIIEYLKPKKLNSIFDIKNIYIDGFNNFNSYTQQAKPV